MVIGILREVNDARVAIVPAIAKKIKDKLGADVAIESGAGVLAFFYDKAYLDAGVALMNRAEVINQSDIIISINALPLNEYATIGKDKIVMALFKPFDDAAIAGQLKDLGIRAFSLDMFPRTTLAQNVDIQSSQASIAGYKAVIIAANILQVYFPMLITAAGSIAPATVLVLGTGVAGLQAIATAKRLGARVEAFDVRKDTKEQAESLGAKFIELAGGAEDEAASGYAVEQTDAYYQKQKALIHERAIKADVIICTARVRGKKAPILIEESTVNEMKDGSVIVDLAADSGGNCAITENHKIKLHRGVTIVGNANPEQQLAKDASTLYSNNVFNFLSLLITAGEANINMENELISSTLITNI